MSINNSSDNNTGLRLFLLYSHYYHPYLTILISGVGVISNFLLFLVLVRPRVLKEVGHAAVHAILSAIAAADFATNITNLGHVIATLSSRDREECKLSGSFLYTYQWNAFLLIHADASVYLHTVSLYLTIVLAALRCCVLKESHGCLPGLATGVRSTLVTASLVGLSCVPNILRNTIVKIGAQRPDRCHGYNESNQSATSFYSVGVPDWWNCPLEQLSFWTYALICKIIPCLLLTYFISGLLKVVIDAGRRRQRLLSTSSMVSRDASTASHDHTTVLLISITFIFWLTELPQGILLILSVLDPASYYSVYQHAGDILDLLSLINSNVNFALYCSMSSKFRREFAETFLKFCCCISLRKLSTQKYGELKQHQQRKRPIIGNDVENIKLAAERAIRIKSQKRQTIDTGAKNYFTFDDSADNSGSQLDNCFCNTKSRVAVARRKNSFSV